MSMRHGNMHVEHRADRCPDCGGELHRCAETRTRYTEDIPDGKIGTESDDKNNGGDAKARD